MKSNIESILHNELSNKKLSSTIFKSEKYLSKNYFPKSIKFRDREFHQMGLLYKDIFKLNGDAINFFQTVTLIGPVGSGKSTVAKIFGQELENYAKQIKLEIKIIYRHINCRRNNSIFLILFDLLRSLIPNFPNRGFSSLELINMLHIVLNTSNSYLVLTLDEIDHIFDDKELDLFFQNLSMELYEQNFHLERRISLIFITRNKDFLLLIDPNNKFGIINNIIKFEKYSNEEIKRILFYKSDDSFKEGVLPFATLDFISNVVDMIGDLRSSFEVLWRAGKNAELANSKIIKIEHAKKALKSILFVNLENDFILNETERNFLTCMTKSEEIIKKHGQINLKAMKTIFFEQYLTSSNTGEEKEKVLNQILEKFEKNKLIKRQENRSSEKTKKLLDNYYLNINPNLLLRIL